MGRQRGGWLLHPPDGPNDTSVRSPGGACLRPRDDGSAARKPHLIGAHRAYREYMPMPKRASVDDYFARLSADQRPHLEALRRLSADVDPEAREVLKWNLPVYVRGDNTNMWMLQNFKHHCSLRFDPPFFATQKAAVEAAGYEAGAGFIKLPYTRELPTKLLTALMKARVRDFEKAQAG